ncbi:hypothetical protein SLEP1_g5666 [Rubroshorea leprosula]|uniref:Uncharacterized protein n=1 Tax=Rubroshorea leprosula TaxID=152421 RepID=A0AAV5HSQ0_9ROSI|nr:hypothetical protein SLEP1_g5666 [Rubroshorea leprosula]
MENKQPYKKQKQQRVLSDNYLHKVASIGVWEKRSSSENHPFRFSIEDQKELKGVFQVIELPEGDSCSDLSGEKGKVDLRLSELKVPFLRENFIDAKCVPMEMELQTPKEVCNGESGGGIMDSKEDYFQNNVQVALSCLPSGCVGFSNSILSCASGRVSTESWPHELDCFSTVPKLKSNFEAFPFYGKIVVLKPNPGKAEDAAKFSPLSTSFGDFHFGDRKGRGLHCHDKGKNLVNDMKPVQKWSSIYYPGRSYMAETAKKQISERWRMTKEFQDGLDSGNRGRSRTLGEMLAMSDYESNPEHSYDKLGEQRLGNRSNPNDKCRYLHRHDNLCMTMTPRFAINWASQNIRKQNFSAKNCSKTRNSGSGCMQSQGVPYLEPENKHLIDGNYVIQNKVKNSIEKNDLSGQHSVASELSRHDVLFSSNHVTREAWLMHKDQKNEINDGNLSGQNSVVSKSFISNCASGHMVSDKVADENMVVDKSSGNHNEHNSYVLETSSQRGVGWGAGSTTMVGFLELWTLLVNQEKEARNLRN